MDLLLRHDFVILCTGHLENISSLNYADLSNVILFHDENWKFPFVAIPIELLRNFHKYWEGVKLAVAKTCFQKF